MQARGRERESGRTSLSLEFVDGDFFKTILIASELYKMVPDKFSDELELSIEKRAFWDFLDQIYRRPPASHGPTVY